MNFMKKNWALFCCLCFLSGNFLFSETVSSIKFSGLKKTKESYMQNLLKDFVGKDSGEINLNEIETILQAEGLFSEINLNFENAENSAPAGESENSGDAEKTENSTVTLNVTLKEKITFLPLPFASYSSDGFMGGFMLMNMNAFGRKNNLILGGVFSKNTQMGLLMFSKPAGDLKHPGFGTFTNFSHKENKITNFDDDTLSEFDSINFRERLNMTEKFNKYFSASIGVEYFYGHFYKNEMDDYHQWLVSTGFNFQKLNWNGWYLVGSGFSADFSAGYSTDWKIIEGISFKASYQIPVAERNRLIFSAGGTIETNKNAMLQADRGKIGCSIMNSNFKTERIAGAMISMEEALFRHKIATVTLYETYEGAIAEDSDEKFVYCHGPGVGLKLYMKQIAFPAMNMGFSYNVNQNFFKFVISIGMSM